MTCVPTRPAPPLRGKELVDRVQARLRTGVTVKAIASLEGISIPLATIIVEDLERRGMASPAESLCASGLGACGGGTGPDVGLHCAGCPLLPLRPRKP